MKKILKQGLNVSIFELRNVANSLYNELKKQSFYSELSEKECINLKWIIRIKNKQPECSDTWEIEK